MQANNYKLKELEQPLIEQTLQLVPTSVELWLVSEKVTPSVYQQSQIRPQTLVSHKD